MATAEQANSPTPYLATWDGHHRLLPSGMATSSVSAVEPRDFQLLANNGRPPRSRNAGSEDKKVGTNTCHSRIHDLYADMRTSYSGRG